MTERILTLPVSIEQIAAVIRQMNQTDQKRLLSLVPELQRAASQSHGPRTEEQARAGMEILRKKVLESLNGQPLSYDEPFAGNMTLGQYNSLSDKDKSGLWDQWEDTDLTESEEKEVRSDALSAG